MNAGKLTREETVQARQFLAFPTGVEVHLGLFIPALESQGSQEQQDFWLPRARSLQIKGAYAQTELAHGTFVRGLETTATYDEATQEFVVHSPQDSSTKWWPGGVLHLSFVFTQIYMTEPLSGLCISRRSLALPGNGKLPSSVVDQGSASCRSREDSQSRHPCGTALRQGQGGSFPAAAPGRREQASAQTLSHA